MRLRRILGLTPAGDRTVGGYASSDRRVTDLMNPPTGPIGAPFKGRPAHEVRLTFGPHSDPPLGLDGPVARAFLDDRPDLPRGRCTNCGTLTLDLGWDDDEVPHWAHVEPGGYSCGSAHVIVEHEGTKPVRPAVALARERVAYNRGVDEGRHREPLSWWEQVGLETWTHGSAEDVRDGFALTCLRSPIDEQFYYLSRRTAADGKSAPTGFDTDLRSAEVKPIRCNREHPPLLHDDAPKASSGVYGEGMTSINVTHSDAQGITSDTEHANGESFFVDERGALHVYDTNGQESVGVYAPGRWHNAAKVENGVVPKHLVTSLAEHIERAKREGGSLDLRLLVDEDGVVALTSR